MSLSKGAVCRSLREQVDLLCCVQAIKYKNRAVGKVALKDHTSRPQGVESTSCVNYEKGSFYSSP